MMSLPNTLSLPTAAVIVILVTSWGTDVIRADDDDDVLCDLTPAEEEELTSAAWQLNHDNNVTGSQQQHSSDFLSEASSRFGSRGLSSMGERAAAVAVDVDVCSAPYLGPAVNQRSSCPWHYAEEELPAGSAPRTLLRANLTCGGECLMVSPDTGRKLVSSYPCLPVHRTVSVLRCWSSSSSSPAPRNGVGAGGSRRCCRTELRAVPVAYTCAFRSRVSPEMD